MAAVRKLNTDPEFKDFVSAQVALSVAGTALETFTEGILKSVHQQIRQNLQGRQLAICVLQCSRHQQRRWCKTCDAWKTELENYLEIKNDVKWKKLKSWEWPNNYHKIAEVFVQPGWDTSDINLQDLSTIFSIWKRCKEIPRSTVNVASPLRKLRNTLVHEHAVKLKLPNADKVKIFLEINNVLIDQNVQPSIQNLNDVDKELTDIEHGRLHRYEEKVDEILEALKKKHHVLTKELTFFRKKLLKDNEQLHETTGRLSYRTNVNIALNSVLIVAFACCMYNYYSNMPLKDTTENLYDSSQVQPDDEGCLSEMCIHLVNDIGIKLESYLDRTNVTGREWLFDILYHQLTEQKKDEKGIVLLAEMGFGKTVIATRSICAHKLDVGYNIRKQVVGYHICRFDIKLTKTADTFIKRLVCMIGSRNKHFRSLIVPESVCFKNYITGDSCNVDPLGCLDECVIQPLKQINDLLQDPIFIVIDALDECERIGGKNVVFQLLKDRLSKFPQNVKLLITARNISKYHILEHHARKIVLSNEDPRNIRDVSLFVGEQLQTNLTTELNMSSFLLASKVAEIKSNEQIPKSIQLFYDQQFRRLFEMDFDKARILLEIICSRVASIAEPDLWSIVTETRSMNKYEFNDTLKRLEHFISYVEGNIHLNHYSVSQWLQGDESGSFFIDQEKGHERHAEYLLTMTKEDVVKIDVVHLVIHLAHSQIPRKRKRKQISLSKNQIKNNDIDKLNYPLHRLVQYCDDTDALDLLLLIYTNFTCTDDNGFNTLFLAAAYGRTNTFKMLIEKGDNVNFRVELYRDVINFIEANRVTFEHANWGYGVLDIAVQNGHNDIVQYILENKSASGKYNFSRRNGMNLYAIHLGCKTGNLKGIQLLSKHFGMLDFLCLYYASVSGYVDIVYYLLSKAIEDNCRVCNETLHWMPVNSSRIQGRKSGTEISFDPREYVLYDDWNMISCESALHAAVRENNVAIVDILLSQPKTAVNCYDRGGRTPLLAAIQYGHTEIMFKLTNKYGEYLNEIECGRIQQIKDIFQLNEIEINRLNTYNCETSYSVFHIAALYNRLEFYEHLHTKHFAMNLNKGDREGCLPAHISACQNNLEVLKYLIKKFNTTPKCRNGSTPLHSAVVCSAPDAFSFLLEIQGLNTTDGSILFQAVEKPLSYRCADEATDRAHVDLLIFKGLVGHHSSNMYALDAFKRNILHYAILHGQFEIVSFLISQFHSTATDWLRTEDADGNTPLQHVIKTLSNKKYYLLMDHTGNIPELKRFLTPTEYSIFITFDYLYKINSVKQSDVYILLTSLIQRKRFVLMDLCIRHTLKGLHTLGSNQIMSLVAMLIRADRSLVYLIPLILPSIGSIQDIVPSVKSYLLCQSSQHHECLLHEISYHIGIPRQLPHYRSLEEFILALCKTFFEIIPSELLTSSYDHDGFNVLERAIQGGNYVFVKCLLNKGVSTRMSARDVIQFALRSEYDTNNEMLFLNDDNSTMLYFNMSDRQQLLKDFLMDEELDQVKKTKLLMEMQQNWNMETVFPSRTNEERDEVVTLLVRKHKDDLQYADICCPICANFSLVHLLSLHGLKNALSELSSIWGNDVLKCNNRDMLTPLYLSRIIGLNKTADYIEGITGKIQLYPNRKAELNLLFKIRTRFALSAEMYSKLDCPATTTKTVLFKPRSLIRRIYCFKRIGKLLKRRDFILTDCKPSKWAWIIVTNIQYLRHLYSLKKRIMNVCHLIDKYAQKMIKAAIKDVHISENMKSVLRDDLVARQNRFTRSGCIDEFINGHQESVIGSMMNSGKFACTNITLVLQHVVLNDSEHFYLHGMCLERQNLKGDFNKANWLRYASRYQYMNAISSTQVYKDVYLVSAGQLDAFMQWLEQLSKAFNFFKWNRNVKT